MNHHILYIIAAMAFVTTVVATPTVMAQNIQRTCNAYYEVRFIEIDHRNVTEDISTIFGQFLARGGCGSTVPNRCRRRARDAAHLCMQRHWQNLNIRYVPEECRTNGVRNYHIADLRQALTDTVCNFMSERNPDYHSAAVSVHAVTHGNKGCGPRENKRKTVELSGHYFIDCNR